MKFNFRKIASVLAGAVMATSTVAFAAAANYPAPFVKGGSADVAVVYGSLPGAEVDLAAVADITNNLQYALAKQTAGTSGGGSSSTPSVIGEAGALFTGGSKLYINNTLSAVKSVVTKTDLPTLLADTSVSGNVDATITQTIDVGSNPQITYAKQPTSSDDPSYGLTTSTTAANYIYNATATFSKAVNFTHTDSKGADLTLFGQKFTVASSTDTTNLVLLKTAEKISLTSDNPSATVTISGKEYTVELVSASDTAATVRVTDADGNSETKEINENASKKVGGVTVAVTNADETNLKLSASVIAGAEKVTLADGSSVTVGEDAKVVDGTRVGLTGGTGALTKLTVSVYAPNSDKDAIIPGGSQADPVFGSFKLDFSSLNIPENSSARDTIKVSPSGDDKLQVTFTPATGSEKSIQFVRNHTVGKADLQWDSDDHNITVVEGENLVRNSYVVVGNEESGHVLKLTTITNQTTGYNNDKVSFQDVLTGDTIDATLSSEGTGTLIVGGKQYSVRYVGDSSVSDENRNVTLNYPDSSAATDGVIYPTIKTSKGAKIAFYEPVVIDLTNWDNNGGDLSTLRFPDGDGYTDVTFTAPGAGTNNWTVGGAGSGVLNTSGSYNPGAGVNLTIGPLTYTLTNASSGATGGNHTTVYLRAPDTGAYIGDPALIIWEEKDDLVRYNAVVVTIEPGATGDDGIGVNDIIRTWHADATWDAISLASDSKKTKEGDYYGAIALVDSGDSDQKTATITYPDEQLYANIYVAAKATEISGGETVSAGSGSVKELGSIIVKDTEAAQVAGKNLVVVGGSCVNKLAAELLGSTSPMCGSAWEQATGVGAGSYLIQTFSRTGGKVATLVAGYHAQDTANAAKAVTTQTIDTTAGKKYKGQTASKAELVAATTTSSGNSTSS